MERCALLLSANYPSIKGPWGPLFADKFTSIKGLRPFIVGNIFQL